jgi:hypothetical protein
MMFTWRTMMPGAAAKKPDPPDDTDDEKESMFWDWDGLPCYRDEAKGIMVVNYGGERRLTELWNFAHQAVPIDEDAFEALKKTVTEFELPGGGGGDDDAKTKAPPRGRPSTTKEK